MAKCSECGFLALRHEYTGSLDEAPLGYRISGIIPVLRQREGKKYESTLAPYEGQPLCFVRAYNLLGELESSVLHPDANDALRVIRRERDCPCSRETLGFTPWQQGFTPKEHREMLDRQWRIEQEDKVREAIWTRENERDRQMQLREDKRDKDARDRHWRELLVFGALIAIATIIGGMLDGLIGNHWWFF